VALAGLRSRALGAAPADQAVVVSLSLPADAIAGLDGVVGAELDRGAHVVGGERERIVRFGPFAPLGTPESDAGHLSQIASYGGIERHATLIAGSWVADGQAAAGGGASAQRPIEATVSEGAARELGMSVGGRARLANRLDPGLVVDVVVVGDRKSVV